MNISYAELEKKYGYSVTPTSIGEPGGMRFPYHVSYVPGSERGTTGSGDIATWQQYCPVCTLALMKSVIEGIPNPFKSMISNAYHGSSELYRESQDQIMLDSAGVNLLVMVTPVYTSQQDHLDQVMNPNHEVMQILKQRADCVAKGHGRGQWEIDKQKHHSGGGGRPWSLGSGSRGRG